MTDRQVDELRRAAPYGTSKMRTSPPTSSASWPRRPRRSEASARCRRGPAATRRCRRPRRCRAPRSARSSGSRTRSSMPPARLARSPDWACPAEAGSRRGRSPGVGRRCTRGRATRARSRGRGPAVRARRGAHELVVLAARQLEVDWVQEPVGRIVERGAERRAGALHEHVTQWRRHALGPVTGERSVVMDSAYPGGGDSGSAIARRKAPRRAGRSDGGCDVRRRWRWRPPRPRPRPPA